jgi:hypothetical protein
MVRNLGGNAWIYGGEIDLIYGMDLWCLTYV